MIIESAGVNKNGAIIDGQGRLRTFTSSENEDRHINEGSGKVWSVNVEGLAVNAGVYGLYIKNTGATHLNITDVRLVAEDATTRVMLDSVSGTVGGGSTVSPISRHLGTTVSPFATIESTTAATGLTGLTQVGNVFPMVAELNKLSHLSTSSNIILNPGAAFAVKFISANATNGITGTVSLVETSPA